VHKCEPRSQAWKVRQGAGLILWSIKTKASDAPGRVKSLAFEMCGAGEGSCSSGLDATGRGFESPELHLLRCGPTDSVNYPYGLPSSRGQKAGLVRLTVILAYRPTKGNGQNDMCAMGCRGLTAMVGHRAASPLTYNIIVILALAVKSWSAWRIDYLFSSSRTVSRASSRATGITSLETSALTLSFTCSTTAGIVCFTSCTTSWTSGDD
jgi:hypothetical protein